MKTTKTLGLFAAAATFGLLSTMCSDDSPGPSATGGAAPTTGGTAPTTGGTAPTTGGTATGGTAPTTGGTATGGTSTGGTATGGTSTGGTATGGTATGGSSTGGTASGGSKGGASGTDGSSSAGGAAGSAGKGGGGAGGASGGGGGMNGGGGSTGGGGGKAGSGGTGGGTTGTFAEVAKIFEKSCVGCHGKGQTMRIDLTNDDMLYTRLTTALAGTNQCVDQILVDKNTPANSLLTKAIQGPVMITGADKAHGCDIARMPKGGMLSAANIATITSWVNAGAPQN